LTCLGKTFAGRVAASLVNAVALPELATQSLEEYEAPALKLRRESAFLSAYRERVEETRPTAPLFDTVPFCTHLELMRPCSTFHERGEAPRSFKVEVEKGNVTAGLRNMNRGARKAAAPLQTPPPEFCDLPYSLALTAERAFAHQPARFARAGS